MNLVRIEGCGLGFAQQHLPSHPIHACPSMCPTSPMPALSLMPCPFVPELFRLFQTRRRYDSGYGLGISPELTASSMHKTYGCRPSFRLRACCRWHLGRWTPQVPTSSNSDRAPHVQFLKLLWVLPREAAVELSSAFCFGRDTPRWPAP